MKAFRIFWLIMGICCLVGVSMPAWCESDIASLTLQANQGNTASQFLLGCMYQAGDGILQDYKQAFTWFEKAANLGDAEAQLMLGLMYEDGEGVAQDYIEAHKWFNLSAAQGNESSRKSRDEISTKMTPSQIEKAQELAKNWKPVKND